MKNFKLADTYSGYMSPVKFNPASKDFVEDKGDRWRAAMPPYIIDESADWMLLGRFEGGHTGGHTGTRSLL